MSVKKDDRMVDAIFVSNLTFLRVLAANFIFVRGKMPRSPSNLVEIGLFENKVVSTIHNSAHVKRLF